MHVSEIGLAWLMVVKEGMLEFHSDITIQFINMLSIDGGIQSFVWGELPCDHF